MRRFLSLLVLPALAGALQFSTDRIAHQGATPSRPSATVLAVISTTTTAAPIPATTAPPPKRASRGAVRVTTIPRAAPTPAVVDSAFWRRLANCECASGHCAGAFLGYFQFSSDTARKVGWFAGASYDEQLAMAQRWLVMIGGRGGSRSGWPVCWWRALRG